MSERQRHNLIWIDYLFTYSQQKYSLCGFGEIQRDFPCSQVLMVKKKFFLAITWLLEGLSKQSLGFVNSEGYLAIEASRWRLSRTTCYGNAFAARTGLSVCPLCVSPSHTNTHILRLTWSDQGWEALCSFFPLERCSQLSHFPSDLPSPSEQNSWTGESFPAGPDPSCKKMTHLLKKLG